MKFHRISIHLFKNQFKNKHFFYLSIDYIILETFFLDYYIVVRVKSFHRSRKVIFKEYMKMNGRKRNASCYELSSFYLYSFHIAIS